MGKRLKEIDLYKVYKNWNSHSGAFGCFFRATNFVTLKHYPDFELYDTTAATSTEFMKLIEHLGSINCENTLIILDLQGEKAIDTAFRLRNDKGLQCILTFNNVLHPFGLVGTKKYISYLVQFGEIIKIIDPRGIAFILDQNRYGEYSEDDLKNNFNNQYELTEEDLPSAEMLRELGFVSVLYISEGESKEDIKSYLEYLEENTIPVLKVELDCNREKKL